MVDAAEPGARPAAERGLLVVDEHAAILDARMIGDAARAEIERRMAERGHVGPPCPRADPRPGADVVQPEDRAAPIRTDDHQRALDTRRRPVDDLLDIALPLAGESAHVDPTVADEPVDRGAVPERSRDHRRADRYVFDETRSTAAHGGQIGDEIGCGPAYRRIVGSIYRDDRLATRNDQRQRAGRRAHASSNLAGASDSFWRGGRGRRRRPQERDRQQQPVPQPSHPLQYRAHRDLISLPGARRQGMRQS